MPNRKDSKFPPLLNLPKDQRQQLLDDLNYLNTAEIKSFCKKHSIPHAIYVETPNGLKRTRDDDRKGIILNRVRHFLKTGTILKGTRFLATVVSFNPLPPTLTAANKLFYGQYDKTNRKMVALLQNLTGGQFKNGAIARILAREFWAKGEAPTFKDFATAWLQAVKEHVKPNPEWAFLSDRARGNDSSDWKKMRAKKATKVLKVMENITAKNSRRQRPKTGDKVVLMEIPPGFLDDLPREDRQAIVAVVGKPVRVNKYDGTGRVELEFVDDKDVLHFIYLHPRFIKLAE